jgi:hypothetical protein
LQRLPFSFYDRKAVGWLMARMTGDQATSCGISDAITSCR